MIIINASHLYKLNKQLIVTYVLFIIMAEIVAQSIMKGSEYCVNDDTFISQSEVTQHMAHLKFDSNKVSSLNIIEMCTAVKLQEKQVLEQLKDTISKEIDKKITVINKDMEVFTNEKTKIINGMREKGLPESFDLSKIIKLDNINSIAVDVEKYIHSLEGNILANMKSISSMFRKDGILVDYETLRLSLSKYSKTSSTNFVIHSFDNHQFTLFDPLSNKDMKYHTDITIESPETIVHNGKIYIVGGLLNKVPTNKVYEFEINSGIFKEKEPMIVSKWCHTLTAYKDNIFSLGGMCGSAVDDCEKFNIKTEKWEKMTNLSKKKYWVAACAGTFPYVPKEKEVRDLKGAEYYSYKFGDATTCDMLYCIGGTNYYSDFDLIERMEINNGFEWEPLFLETSEGWGAKKMLHCMCVPSKNEVLIFSGADIFKLTMKEEKAKLKLTRDFTEAHISKAINAEKAKISAKKNVPIDSIKDHDVHVAKDFIIEENIKEIRHSLFRVPARLKNKDYFTACSAPYLIESAEAIKIYLVGTTRNLNIFNYTKNETSCLASEAWIK